MYYIAYVLLRGVESVRVPSQRDRAKLYARPHPHFNGHHGEDNGLGRVESTMERALSVICSVRRYSEAPSDFDQDSAPMEYQSIGEVSYWRNEEVAWKIYRDQQVQTAVAAIHWWV